MINLNPKKILIPVDFSKTSLKAVRHGAFLAKLFKGEVILLHVQKQNELTDIILPALNIKSVSTITNILEDKLEDLADETAKKFGIPVTTLVSTGNTTSEITAIAEEYNTDLIVMGTRGSDSQSDLFLGSNAYRVLTKSEVPVLTVRNNSAKVGYSTILLPLDSSAHSRQKVHATVQLASRFGSVIHVLGLLGKGDKNYEYKMEVILRQIKQIAASEDLLCKTRIVKTDNHSQETLDYAAKINADLIITMEDEKEEFSKAILSTYAHELINNSRIPVLSIPPEIHVENFEPDSIGGMW